MLKQTQPAVRIIVLALSGTGLIMLLTGLMFTSSHSTASTAFPATGIGLIVLGPIAGYDMHRHGRRALILVGGLLGAVLGIFVSQYAPLFGGFLVSEGEPWSPARMSGLSLHTLLLAGVGFALGVLSWRMEQAQPATPPDASRGDGRGDTAERLRKLERLKGEGLITDDEYADKRKALLDDV